MRIHLFTHVILLLLPTLSLAEVGLTSQLGQTLKIEKLKFTDESGDVLTLSSFFRGKNPVIIAPVYYRCPGICTVTLSELFQTVRRSGLTPGTAFETVVISVDPSENPAMALQKKKRYLKDNGFSQNQKGFHFLTGENSQISEMMKELGFNFDKNKFGEGFDHPSALFILSAQGVITNTLTGLQITNRGFHQALVAAVQDRPVGYFNRLVNFCSTSTAKSRWWRFLKAWFNRAS